MLWARHSVRDAALGICRRAEIELCSRLLSVSAHGLHDNPGLVFFVIVAQVPPPPLFRRLASMLMPFTPSVTMT